jgi:Rrf2 family protein
MNLITRDTDYAIRALMYLARRPTEEVVPVPVLAETLEIPRPYLRSILQTLSRHGVLKSRRGTGGGFALTQDPRKIGLADLATIFQGSIDLTRCVLRDHVCPERSGCPLRVRLLKIQAHVAHELSQITIADLLADAH